MTKLISSIEYILIFFSIAHAYFERRSFSKFFGGKIFYLKKP